MVPKRAYSKGARPHSGLAILLGIIGEVLITLGIVLGLFVAWELWWTNIDADRDQDAAVEQMVDRFAGQSTIEAEPGPKDPVEASAADRARYGAPRPASMVGEGAFGVLYVPRFGPDYARPINEGVDNGVLDHLGIGHYPQTQAPGEAGNFAVAGHRQSHGQVFWNIDKLTSGDYLYVQTQEGYYTYRYTSTEIVHPSDGSVLLPVPHQPQKTADESLLTMTSCDPPFTTRMRIIAYAQLESWRPSDAGPPAPVAEAVDNAAGK